jgi:NitT/TauT family transport system permease protein
VRARTVSQVAAWLPAAVVLLAVLALWQGAIAAFHIQRFLLPKPSEIASTLWHDRSTLASAGWYTFKEALGGFVGGSLLGVAFATVVARFRRVGAAFMPVAIAANAVPIIAFAPIANAWFGEVSPHSKMAIAGVLCFFPVMINTLRGLTSVRPHQLELMRAYAAGELEIFRRVRVPTALPYVFTALKVASVLSMIGAIVGEWFGGASENALGVLINSDAAIFDFTTAWAGIVVASLLGIALYLAVVLSERALVRWTPEARHS